MREYFDRQEEAKTLGRKLGMIDGQRIGHELGFHEGQQVGYNQGYQAGQRAGYDHGWEEAIARGNEEMLKQMAFTREHVADKEVLAHQLREQHALVQQLQDRVAELEEQDRARTHTYDAEMRGFKRDFVFLNTARDTLDELLQAGEPVAQLVKTTFASKYRTRVADALKDKAIAMSLDQDPAFANDLPKTHAFLLRMLGSTAINYGVPASSATFVAPRAAP